MQNGVLKGDAFPATNFFFVCFHLFWRVRVYVCECANFQIVHHTLDTQLSQSVYESGAYAPRNTTVKHKKNYKTKHSENERNEERNVIM